MADLIASWQSFAIYGYALFSIAMVIAAAVEDRRLQFKSLLFCGVSISFLLIVRWPVIMLDVPLNPDEAQMIANAMKFAVDPVPWRSVDTTSSGPLNSMVLMWPYLIGQDVTFATARLTAVGLISGAWLFIYGALKGVPPVARIGAAAIMMMLLIATGSPDFLHYSSERLSIFLLCAPIFLMITQRSTWSFALTGLALGCVPFAKLQAAPIAFALGAAVVAAAWFGQSDHVKKAAAAIVAGCAPTALIVALMSVAGDLHELWDSYLGWAITFMSSRGAVPNPARIMQTDPGFTPYFAGALVIVFVGAVTCWRSIVAGPRQIWAIGIGALFFIMSLGALLSARAIFAHYLLLMIAPLAFLCGVVWSSLKTKRNRLVCATTFSVVLTIVCVGSLFGPRFVVIGLAQATSPFERHRLFSWVPVHSGGLLVWGWAPELHVYSGIPPATHDTQSWNQTHPSSRLNYFRARLMDDLSRSPPAIIVDAAAPGAFYYTSPERYGILTFPALASAVEKGFTRISAPGTDCPRTYVRTDLLSQVHFAKVKSISASAYLTYGNDSFLPQFVDDFNIYENCRDRWLLPDQRPGHIDLVFTHDDVVLGIHVLNTRNGTNPTRASLDGDIILFNKEHPVFTERVVFQAYPNWTMVPVPHVEADKLRVEIATSAGGGGGLNEIKIITDH